MPHLPKKELIEVHIHEGATIASGVFTLEVEYQCLINLIRAELEKIAKWVDKEGGLIGHIKAYLKRGESGVLLSITDFDEQVSIQHNKGRPIEVNIAAIVYNIAPELLQTRFGEMIEAIQEGELTLGM